MGVVIIGAVLSTCGCNGSRDRPAVVERSDRHSFFSSLGTNVTCEHTPYLSLGDRKAPLTGIGHEAIVQEFACWLRLTLRPEYIPSVDFIRTNLQLYPAEVPYNPNTQVRAESRDRALLAFRIGQEDFTVVETGGGDGETRLFISRHGLLPRNLDDRLVATAQAIQRYCNVTTLPSQAIVDINHAHTRREGEVLVYWFDRSFQGIASRHELLVSVYHLCYGGPGTYYFYDDEWFDYTETADRIRQGKLSWLQSKYAKRFGPKVRQPLGLSNAPVRAAQGNAVHEQDQGTQ